MIWVGSSLVSSEGKYPSTETTEKGEGNLFYLKTIYPCIVDMYSCTNTTSTLISDPPWPRRLVSLIVTKTIENFNKKFPNDLKNYQNDTQ